MRSEANLRLSECQPLPGFGSRPASLSALSHHPCASAAPMHAEGFLGAGSTGASPVPGFTARAAFNATRASEVTGVMCS